MDDARAVRGDQTVEQLSSDRIEIEGREHGLLGRLPRLSPSRNSITM